MKQKNRSFKRFIEDVFVSNETTGGLTQENFNCRVLLQDTYDALQLAAKAKNLKYSLQFSSEFPEFLVGDPSRIRHALTNLLSNAIKFTAQGQITVLANCQLMETGVYKVYCEITDTGIGIAQNRLETLFSAKSRPDDAITRIYQGAGMGLTVARALINSMRGRIGVISQPGIGSTFWFWVELARSKSTPKTANKAKNYRFNAKVLLAEDYPASQAIAQRLLEGLGCKVIIVGNGYLALKAMQKERFDLVLMDCEMPFMDGYQATKQFRRLEQEQQIDKPMPILALTNRALNEDEALCQQAGMDEWVTKPFTRQDLGKALYKWLPKELLAEEEFAPASTLDILLKASKVSDELHPVSMDIHAQQFRFENNDDLAFMSSVTQAFQDQAALILSQLQLSLDNSNTVEAAKLLGKLKSVSSNIGCGNLIQLCQEMQDCLENNKEEQLQPILDNMKQEYLRALTKLNAMCAQAIS